MSNTKSCLIAAAIMSLVFVGAPQARAEMSETQEKFGKKNWQERSEEMYKKLGLSDEQQQKLKEGREKNRAQMKDIHEKMKAKKEEIRAEIEKENFDVDKVKAIHAEVKALRAKTEDNRLESILAVREVLTAEQYQKFMELRKDRRRGKNKGEWHKHFKKDKE